MKIYYVSWSWPESESSEYVDEVEFFATRELAQALLLVKLEEQAERWRMQESRAFEKWQATEDVVQALEKLGVDWKVTLPRHTREFSYPPCNNDYVIREVEVTE